MKPLRYLGIMSGTSVDAIDVALVDFSKPRHDLLRHTHTQPWPQFIKNHLLTLQAESSVTLRELLNLRKDVTNLFAQAVVQVLQETQLTAKDIKAIGCHGQTIAHCPDVPATYQLCCGAQLATLTGIDVVTDFRAKDLALGGQGAPLAGAFHAYLWDKAQTTRLVINLGGIANVTVLDGSGRAVMGFDTGPANTLLDAWYRRHHPHASFDRDGAFAQQGRVLPKLLACLLQHPFFQKKPPKSADRHDFSLQWLDGHLKNNAYALADVQATVQELTLESIARGLDFCPEGGEIWLCGGGANNPHLVAGLKRVLPKWRVDSTQKLGLHPQWVESCAFAWLAAMFLKGRCVALSAVTGASADGVLGGYYPA